VILLAPHCSESLAPSNGGLFSSSKRATSPLQNRVGGLRRRSSGRLSRSRSTRPETATGSTAFSCKTASGRSFFLSRDPIGVRGGINLYAYVGGTPTSSSDPLGLAGWGGAASNTGDWATGHKGGDTNYGPDTGEAQEMSRSIAAQKLTSYFTSKNSGILCNDWQGVSDFKASFDFRELFGEHSNGTAEFVGSARGDVVIGVAFCNSGSSNGSVVAIFVLTNTTSLTSLLYGLWPNAWNVTKPGAPLSNWTQTYEWTQTYSCKCCDSN